MNHFRQPALLFRQILVLQMHARLLSPPIDIFCVPVRDATESGGRIALFADEDLAEFKDGIDIFRRFDDGIVLQNGDDDGVSYRATCGEGLDGEESAVLLQSEKGQYGGVRLNGCEEEGGEVVGRLL